jgi:hypothetical protein
MVHKLSGKWRPDSARWALILVVPLAVQLLRMRGFCGTLINVDELSGRYGSKSGIGSFQESACAAAFPGFPLTWAVLVQT